MELKNYKYISTLGETTFEIDNQKFTEVCFTDTVLNNGTNNNSFNLNSDTIINQDTTNGTHFKNNFFKKVNVLENYTGYQYEKDNKKTGYYINQVLYTFFQLSDYSSSAEPNLATAQKLTNVDKIHNWIPKMLNKIQSTSPELFENLFNVPKCYITLIPEFGQLTNDGKAYTSYGGNFNVKKHLSISFKIQYFTKNCQYVLSKNKRQNKSLDVVYCYPLKNDEEYISVNIPGGIEEVNDSDSMLLPDLTDEVYENTTGLIKLPDVCENLWDRTNNLRTHVTHWDANGQIVTTNDKFIKYVDPNCYAYTQYVWKKDNENWYQNYTYSAIAERQCLWVSGAWFTEDDVYSTDPGSAYNATWYPYTILPNGQGHNPYNGFTIGFDATPYWSNYPDGRLDCGFAGVNSGTQSALCFTNLLNFTENNGRQKQIYAYTEGDDFEQTIVKGVTPGINLSIKGQNIGRFNLETNNMLTRW